MKSEMRPRQYIDYIDVITLTKEENDAFVAMLKKAYEDHHARVVPAIDPDEVVMQITLETNRGHSWRWQVEVQEE